MDPRKAYNLLNDHLITGLPLEGLSQAKRTWFNQTIIHTFIAVDNELSRIVRKPDFCLGENKGADQLRGNREADQRLCFRYSDSTIPLLLKSEISSF